MQLLAALSEKYVLLNKKTKIQGIGLGLRFPHFDTLLKNQPNVPWFEVISEDFLEEGPHHKKLEILRKDYPLVFHSIGMNIGGVDELNHGYLQSLKTLYEKFQPEWISDHLCWSRFGKKFHHDLLPIPRTQEGLDNAVTRINKLQDKFKTQLVVENITSYLEFKNQTFTESEFIHQILKRTGCHLLLDISNLLINETNKGLSAKDFIEALPKESIRQVHLSGGETIAGTLIDTHSQKVGTKDIEILKKLYTDGFKIPAMIEWDSSLPSFSELEAERQKVVRAINEL